MEIPLKEITYEHYTKILNEIAKKEGTTLPITRKTLLMARTWDALF